jgi:hypothetical protein
VQLKGSDVNARGNGARPCTNDWMASVLQSTEARKKSYLGGVRPRADHARNRLLAASAGWGIRSAELGVGNSAMGAESSGKEGRCTKYGVPAGDDSLPAWSHAEPWAWHPRL